MVDSLHPSTAVTGKRPRANTKTAENVARERSRLRRQSIGKRGGEDGKDSDSIGAKYGGNEIEAEEGANTIEPEDGCAGIDGEDGSDNADYITMRMSELTIEIKKSREEREKQGRETNWVERIARARRRGN